MHTRSSGQEPTSPYSEPERFIHRTKKKKKKRNPFIPLEDRVPKVNYPPFENLFEGEVVYNPFLDLPFPMADDQPMWGNNRAVAPTPEATIIALDLGDNFIMKAFGRHFGGYTRDLGSFREETGKTTNLHEHLSRLCSQQLETASQITRDAVTILTKTASRTYKKKKPTMHTEDIEEADIKETTTTYDPPVNPNAKTTIIHDDSEDEVDEAEKEVESSSSKQTKSSPPSLKAYKPKIPYPQRLRKEKMEERYAKFIDLIKEIRINIPLVDVLAGMPNYGKFLKDLVSNKVKCLALADLGTSINMMPYSLYTPLSEITLKPMRKSIRLANHTYQYPMGVAKNMLVQVGKFVFPVDFVILQMEEDDKVPFILRRPFLHIADAIIRVKNKELNLGVGDDKITFLINKAMQHSHLNDDTCFHTDVIDEVIEEELDALLDDSKPFLNTPEKINETSLNKEFEEFMAVDVEEIPKQEKEVENNFKELTLKGNLRIKTYIQEPPTNLEMKPLPKHLEYAFLEKRFSSSSSHICSAQIQ
ncbi:reverse transcriptase domain-containing protein [Tanacetum coccineum]